MNDNRYYIMGPAGAFFSLVSEVSNSVREKAIRDYERDPSPLNFFKARGFKNFKAIETEYGGRSIKDLKEWWDDIFVLKKMEIQERVRKMPNQISILEYIENTPVDVLRNHQNDDIMCLSLFINNKSILEKDFVGIKWYAWMLTPVPMILLISIVIFIMMLFSQEISTLFDYVAQVGEIFKIESEVWEIFKIEQDPEDGYISVMDRIKT